ncbi:MAG: hypothetical protein NVV59_07815 [Chitinophagaceae bacterium]|nr:hypothetical protein [Chitinophagaceae bacterium]
MRGSMTGGEGWDLSTDTLKLSWVRFSVGRSLDDKYHVVLRRHANGSSREDAMDRAEKIVYSVRSYDDVLDLANGFAIGKEAKYRAQHVEVEIKIPVGKKIRFDRSIHDKLNPVNVKIKRRNSKGIIDMEVTDDWGGFRFQSDKDYLMDADGNLRDEQGRVLNRNTGRVYERRNSQEQHDSFEIKRQLEREKEKKEESERRIRELEEKQNELKKGDNTQRINGR